MAYVEVKAKTVELAIEAAMAELKVSDRDGLDVKVIQEPERGFLGFGGQDAIVRVEEKSSSSKSRRSRRNKSGKPGGSDSNQGGRQGGSRGRNQSGQARASGKDSGNGGGGNGGGNGGSRGQSGKKSNSRSSQSRQNSETSKSADKPAHEDDRDEVSVNSQEPMVKAFLAGLVESFGLEGDVQTSVEDDVVVAKVVGDQTEALVGPRGSVMEAVHELTKTVLQRSVQDSARVRIDIAGYAERRRQALTIYAGELIDQVLEDRGEIMLEPMAASDRKVIHDAVGARDGVRSYSEGESPKRYVVIAPTEDDGAGEEE